MDTAARQETIRMRYRQQIEARSRPLAIRVTAYPEGVLIEDIENQTK